MPLSPSPKPGRSPIPEAHVLCFLYCLGSDLALVLRRPEAPPLVQTDDISGRLSGIEDVTVT